MKKNATTKSYVFSMVLLFLLAANAAKAQSYFAGTSAGTGNTSVSSVGVGYQVLSSSNTGSSVSGFGFKALVKNTTGDGNTAIGSLSMSINTTGYYNSAVGSSSLNSNTTGYFNCAFGSQALYANTTGNQNVAAGRTSLLANKTGHYNVAVGGSTLEKNESAVNNTAVGFNALQAKVNGDSNVAIGSGAGKLRDLYNRCTFIGSSADAKATGLVNATAIGNRAQVDASNKVIIGNTAVTYIGGWAGWTNFSDRRLKTNINKSKLGLHFILSLNPVTYNYIVKGQENILHTGLIAQEVEEAAKKAGVPFSAVDKNGPYWGIRYGELTVPLITAVQEMEEKHKAEVEILNSRIAKLEEAIAGLLQKQPGNPAADKRSFLFQNNPNPFNGNTTIRYMIKTGDENAAVVIRDIKGRAMKQVNIQSAGTGSIKVNPGEFAAGTYTYSLTVKGELVDTKLMIITN